MVELYLVGNGGKTKRYRLRISGKIVWQDSYFGSSVRYGLKGENRARKRLWSQNLDGGYEITKAYPSEMQWKIESQQVISVSQQEGHVHETLMVRR